MQGNRLATLLMVLQAPGGGGETIFTIAGLKLQPKAGDAILFWNLHSAGHGDMQSMHAGCPPTGATKWIANKWFRIGAPVQP